MVRKLKIICDSREKDPLFEGEDVVREKIDTGDYSLEGLKDEVSIERKSCADLYGTLFHGHDRFKRELMRSQSLKYFAIVVEGGFTKTVSKRFNGAKYIEASGETLRKIVETITVKYNIHIIFCKDRDEAATRIKGLLRAYERINEKYLKERVQK